MRKDSQSAHLTEVQRKAAQSGVKAMIEIDRPFLDYVITALADAGFDDICLIIGPEHDMIRDYYDNVPKSRVKISYAIQEEPLGTANAVASAREFANGDPIVVLNSDNYYPVEAFKALHDHVGSGLVGFDREAMFQKSNIPHDRVRAFGLVTADADGNLDQIVEKPSPERLEELVEQGAVVSMNLWKFTDSIFDAADSIELSPRGEYEIIDAVRKASDDGEPFAVIPSDQGVLDLSNQDDIASVVDALHGVEVSL